MLQPAPHIAVDADICSGFPRVAGTRIRVSNIVLWMEQGQSPDEIVLGYPQLTIADIYAAMAYYFDNREEMDRSIADDAEFVEQMMASTGVLANGQTSP